MASSLVSAPELAMKEIGKVPGRPIIYTLSACPACIKLKQDWISQGREFEERAVDASQEWLNEALKYGDIVPITVYADGRVEIGYANMISCYIA